MSNLISVSSLNTKIKSLLEATFMHIMVEGEVASVTYHTSGHLYFSIKDDKSSIKCVMWRSSVAKMKFRIEKGMHVVINGSVSVYTPRGEYQLQAVKIEPYGQGALAVAFEQMKEKLKAKGYFDALRKRPIPKRIGKIALVTAKESAALYDMLKVIEKRWPLIEVIVVDTPVQGDSAAVTIAKALRHADTLGADVVVFGRGGGSVEDLWAFNEEVVADAVFAMRTPTVSAVGHEVDVLISDHVADLRAPTPSAAMEMILPDKNEALFLLDETVERLRAQWHHSLSHKQRSVEHVRSLLIQNAPVRRLQETALTFVRLEEEFLRHMRYLFERYTMRLSPQKSYFDTAMGTILERKERQAHHLFESLLNADPRRQLKEGLAEISRNGKRIALSEIVEGERFSLEDGTVRAEALCIKVEKTNTPPLSKKEI